MKLILTCHQVIPEQLPVNDRQIDDVVEELLVRQQEGEDHKDNEVDSNLRPLLQLHGGSVTCLQGDKSKWQMPSVDLEMRYSLIQLQQ